MATPVEKIFSSANARASESALSAPEQFFDSLGMMAGPSAPIARAVTGAVLGALVIYAVRPGFAFNKDGSAKSLSQARVPWWSFPVAGALICGVFI